MKAKLLKRLRAEAKKQFWIEYHASNSHPWWVKELGQPKDIAMTMCITKDSARKCLASIREHFILERIIRKLDE